MTFLLHFYSFISYLDFLEYFVSVAPALTADKSLFAVSAWNDNGFKSKMGPKSDGGEEIYYLLFSPHAISSLASHLMATLHLKS
jgi:hypothetical protein